VKKNTRGNCYVTCEALYHLLGGKAAGRLVPMVLKHEGDTHWYLEKRWNETINGHIVTRTIIIDPTVKQFKTRPDYSKGRGCGFLTKKPSKRARELMRKLLWQ
jgi:hypothetical protein